MRGLLLIVTGILLVAGLWSLTGRIPSDRTQDVADGGGALSRDPEAVSDPSLPNTHPGAPESVARIWQDWPVPELALLVTGEQHGFFEPCGCTANQMGGMARRADLREKLTAAGWKVRGVDLGGLSRRTVRQAEIKFETTARALRDLGYVAVGLGPEELRLKPEFLLTQDIDGDAADAMKFVSCNLVFYDSPDLGTPVPSRVLVVGGRRLGITSVMGEAIVSEVIPEGANTGITWSDPDKAIEKVLDQFAAQDVDFRVLLSQSLPAESRRLAEKFPQFDVVVTADGFSDPDPRSSPEIIGDTLFLQVGHKGKYVGVLGIYSQDTDPSVRFQLIPLERREFADNAKMIDHMHDYQDRLKYEEVVLTDGVAMHPSGATFVGAERCGECHTTAFDTWQSTPHAHAFQSLDPAFRHEGYERLNGVPRIYDPECLSCHVTGWDPQEYIRFGTGFLNEEFARSEEEPGMQQLLAGNQCENCHGPGSRHVVLIKGGGDVELARQQVRVTLEEVKSICYRCHDADNSPDFDFDEYWPDVEHYGLD